MSSCQRMSENLDGVTFQKMRSASRVARVVTFGPDGLDGIVLRRPVVVVFVGEAERAVAELVDRDGHPVVCHGEPADAVLCLAAGRLIVVDQHERRDLDAGERGLRDDCRPDLGGVSRHGARYERLRDRRVARAAVQRAERCRERRRRIVGGHLPEGIRHAPRAARGIGDIGDGDGGRHEQRRDSEEIGESGGTATSCARRDRTFAPARRRRSAAPPGILPTARRC